MDSNKDPLPQKINLGDLTRDELRLIALAWAVNKMYVTRHVSGVRGGVELKMLESTFNLAFVLSGGPDVANGIDAKFAEVLRSTLEGDGITINSDSIHKAMEHLKGIAGIPSEEHNTPEGIAFDDIIPPSIRKRMM